jgi:hypothetical protein
MQIRRDFIPYTHCELECVYFCMNESKHDRDGVKHRQEVPLYDSILIIKGLLMMYRGSITVCLDAL